MAVIAVIAVLLLTVNRAAPGPEGHASSPIGTAVSAEQALLSEFGAEV
jgi:hypothetical protein